MIFITNNSDLCEGDFIATTMDCRIGGHTVQRDTLCKVNDIMSGSGGHYTQIIFLSNKKLVTNVAYLNDKPSRFRKLYKNEEKLCVS